MDRPRSARTLYDLSRAHREQLLRWIAETGLAMAGLVALMSVSGLVWGWNHHLHLSSPPGQGGALAVSVLAVCVLAALTWVAFTLSYSTVARVGSVLLAVAALAVAVSAIVAPGPTAPGLAHAEALVSALVLITLLGFCSAIYLSSKTFVRRDKRDRAQRRVSWAGDTRDRTLPKLGWPVALPYFLLAYGLGFTGLYLSLAADDSVFIGAGDPLSAIGYATAVLGFAVAGTLRSRESSAYGPLAASAATALSIPLVLGGVLFADATHRPMTGPLVALTLTVVLIPALGWLAQHRATTTPLPTASVCSPEGTK